MASLTQRTNQNAIRARMGRVTDTLQLLDATLNVIAQIDQIEQDDPGACYIGALIYLRMAAVSFSNDAAAASTDLLDEVKGECSR